MKHKKCYAFIFPRKNHTTVQGINFIQFYLFDLICHNKAFTYFDVDQFRNEKYSICRKRD